MNPTFLAPIRSIPILDVLQEEEKDATISEGSASPISALSGSMRSHGHDLSHLRKDWWSPIG